MKHVIVIGTADDVELQDPEIMREFQATCIKMAECAASHYVGECYVMSEFYVPSAIDAVLKMFGTSRSEIAAAEARKEAV